MWQVYRGWGVLGSPSSQARFLRRCRGWLKSSTWSWGRVLDSNFSSDIMWFSFQDYSAQGYILCYNCNLLGPPGDARSSRRNSGPSLMRCLGSSLSRLLYVLPSTRTITSRSRRTRSRTFLDPCLLLVSRPLQVEWSVVWLNYCPTRRWRTCLQTRTLLISRTRCES